MTIRAFVPALVAMIALVACGGGGGGGGDTTPPPTQQPQQPQTIAFANAGPVYAYLEDGVYSNPASGGAGVGAITYKSDTPSAATVDVTTGRVTINSVGDVVITASKAGDGSFTAAQASYSLHIATKTVGINAWIGSSDTDVTFLSNYLTLNFT